MNLKKWAPAVLAIALGGVAAMLARNMMNKSHSTTVITAVQVVTATGPLMVGQEIKPENVTLTTIPAPQPPNAFNRTADVVGHTLTSSLVQGQNVTTSDLAPTGVSAGLQSLIPPGKRAITLNVDEVNGQVGMLLPGCRIDVLATIANGKASVTRAIVSNVLIQATGTRLNSAKPEEGKEPGPYHTVTLIVTVREAELLELASGSSRVRMLLRGSRKAAPGEDDDDADGAEGITVADLIGEAPGSSGAVAVGPNNSPTTMPANTVAVSKPKWTVELIKGAGSTPVRVDFDMPRPKPIMVDIDQSQAIPGAADEKNER
jgi:pilus assembly protein CpaB